MSWQKQSHQSAGLLQKAGVVVGGCSLSFHLVLVHAFLTLSPTRTSRADMLYAMQPCRPSSTPAAAAASHTHIIQSIENMPEYEVHALGVNIFVV